MSQVKNSPDEFSQQIALECQKLDAIFSQETFNYHNTASLQGKSWFSIGLENNDNDQQKDSAHKFGVIGRMVDGVIGFIKTLIERIKSFLSKRADAKRAEFTKEYKGPSDETIKKQATTGEKTVDPAQSKEAWAQSVAKKFSLNDKAMLSAMLETSFNKDINFVADKSHEYLSREHTGYDNVRTAAEVAATLKEYIGNCNKTISEKRNVPVEKLNDKLVEVFISNHETQEKLTLPYYGFDLMVKHSEKFLDSLIKVMETLKNSDRSDAPELVKIARQLSVDTAALLALYLNITQTYDRLRNNLS